MALTKSSKKWIVLSSFVAILGFILIGIYFLLPEKTEPKKTSNYGKAMVVGIQSERVQVWSSEKESQLLAEWELPLERLIPVADGTSIMAITQDNPRHLYQITYDTDTPRAKALKQTVTVDINETTQMKWAMDLGAFYQPETKTFTFVNPEYLLTDNFQTEQDVEAWTITDSTLYYAMAKQIFAYDLETKQSERVLDLQDQTITLLTRDDSLFVVSQFGSQTNVYTLLEYEFSTKEIVQLTTLSAVEIDDLPTWSLSNVWYYATKHPKTKETMWASYDLIEFEKKDALSLPNEPLYSIWIGNQFYYGLTKSGKPSVYYHNSNRPMLQLDLTVTDFYPLYEKANES